MGRTKKPDNVFILPGTCLPGPVGDGSAFVPTIRMEDARAAVRELVDKGDVWPEAWLEEFAKRAAKGRGEPIMSGDEWREWNVLPGFHDWWYDNLYPVPNKYVEGALFMAWQKGAATALLKGDPRWLIYCREQMFSQSGEEGSVLEEIMGTQKKNPWKPEPEEEEGGA